MSQADSHSARRIRNSALGLLVVVLAFYFGIIALLIYRSHH
jgi:hypothetical protein